MVTVAVSFIPVPTRNPAKVPSDDFNASVQLLSDWKSSATNAPRRLHGIIPNGVKNIPIIIPMSAPWLPALVPPASLVNLEGTM